MILMHKNTKYKEVSTNQSSHRSDQDMCELKLSIWRADSQRRSLLISVASISGSE